ncbi:MAG: PEPxxWA-CTERM sorting domain-containing protein [Sphingomonadaceae bacterium]
MFSTTRLAIVAAGALAFSGAANAATTTFLQFFQVNSAPVFQVTRVPGSVSVNVTNAPVIANALAFTSNPPVLFTNAVFNLSATSFEAVQFEGDAATQSGFAGALSFTSGVTNLLTLTFETALLSSNIGSVAGGFSTSVPPDNVTISSDIFDIANFAGGNFALSLSGMSLPFVGSANAVAVGNVSGTFAASTDVAVVPEPATWGLMIAGFGMVGFAARRRRMARVAA